MKFELVLVLGWLGVNRGCGEICGKGGWMGVVKVRKGYICYLKSLLVSACWSTCYV